MNLGVSISWGSRMNKRKEEKATFTSAVLTANPPPWWTTFLPNINQINSFIVELLLSSILSQKREEQPMELVLMSK